jgi:DNA-binding NtrC family response regulator
MEATREYVLRVLEECRWRIKGKGNAAERLGVAPSTLRYRLKKLGIQRPPRDFEGPESIRHGALTRDSIMMVS